MNDYISPHCDHRVLHAPGVCVFCDKYPERQAGRLAAGICFTGEDPATRGIGWIDCPADIARGRGGAHVWPGNTPKAQGEVLRAIQEANRPEWLRNPAPNDSVAWDDTTAEDVRRWRLGFSNQEDC